MSGTNDGAAVKRRCPVCRSRFVPWRRDQVLCGSRDCHRAYNPIRCRQRYNRLHGRQLDHRPGRCPYCNKRLKQRAHCYAPACKAKRLADQVKRLETALSPDRASLVVCQLPVRGGVCASALSFGTDGMGRTVMWCPRHGESLVPIIGTRRYDQRVVLDDEIDAAIARASKRPAPNDGAGLNGAHFRRQSNAYAGDHPWRHTQGDALNTSEPRL